MISFAAEAQTSPCATPGAINWLEEQINKAVPSSGPIMWKLKGNPMLSEVEEVVKPLQLIDTPGGHVTDQPATTACIAQFKTMLVLGRSVDNPPAHIYNIVTLTFDIRYSVEDSDNVHANATITNTSVDFENLQQSYKLDKGKR